MNPQPATRATRTPARRQSGRDRDDGFQLLADVGLAARLTGEPERAVQNLRQLQTQAAWRRVVGAHLDGLTRAVGMRARTLLVEVPDSAWKRELTGMKPRLLFRLTEALTEAYADDISFRVAPAGAGCRSAALPVKAGPDDACGKSGGIDAADLDALLESVSDPSLREHLARVIQRYPLSR